MKFQAFVWNSNQWSPHTFVRQKTGEDFVCHGFPSYRQIFAVQGTLYYPSFLAGYLLLASESKCTRIRTKATELLIQYLAGYKVGIFQADIRGAFCLPGYTGYTTFLLTRF